MKSSNVLTAQTYEHDSPRRLPVHESDLIFICGFARGGTSWLRDCVAAHPDVSPLPSEIVYQPTGGSPGRARLARKAIKLYRKYGRCLSLLNLQRFAEIGKDAFLAEILDAIKKHDLPGPRFVSKAPANSVYLDSLCRLFPKSKFLFIVRDPRDVLVSHQRGTRGWMKGANSTVDGCMEKLRLYYESFLEASQYQNLMLVQYEKLHQDFYTTSERIFSFLGLRTSPDIVRAVYKKSEFAAQTGRRYTEDPSSPRRKGVIGEWGTYLSEREKGWYAKRRFWQEFLGTYGYPMEPLTYEGILTAMQETGVHALDETELLGRTINRHKANLLLLHDIDALGSQESRNSIVRTAEIEGRLGLASFFNFLPLDDERYRHASEREVLRLMEEIKTINPRATFGLHFNAAERYFAAGAEDAADDHPAMKVALDYLHQQIDDYARHGITFKLATAHGYGRGKKRPNNRDSQVFTNELTRRDVMLFDTVIRPEIDKQASCCVKFTDVGGAFSIRDMPHGGMPDIAESYRMLPAGCLIRFLTHPGNYRIDRALVLATRIYHSPEFTDAA